MKRILLLLLGMMAIPASSLADSAVLLPQKIEVFSNRALTITGLEQTARLTPRFALPSERLKIFDLDAVSALEHDISVGLPADPAEAKRVAAQRMSTLTPDRILRFARAYQGVIQAKRYGLTMFPAVVFDGGHSVVYGETDLAVALGLYHAWKAQRGNAP